MKSLLALLFCIGALVASTAAQLLYEQLPKQHRRAIDRTVEDFNSNQRKAFRFYELIDPVKETELPFDRSYLNLHFVLKETGCLQKSVKNLHQCKFFDSKPRMDCVGCFIAGSDHFEEEFIDCVQRNQVTKEIQNKRAEECDKLHPYHLGGSIALASRQESER
ncbi:cathelicidin-related peptide Oh-Cath-like [Acipenser ruthenus]|uniref:cathelicidin-related peptide Oh-Cath-like n=1 Tax=Acipenser ruthenus TaxID=7906 RepID=UPI001561269A|nr:cathelicidin-related peptide Oh-Cath-like [Acipenser ruthenus]